MLQAGKGKPTGEGKVAQKERTRLGGARRRNKDTFCFPVAEHKCVNITEIAHQEKERTWCVLKDREVTQTGEVNTK